MPDLRELLERAGSDADAFVMLTPARLRERAARSSRQRAVAILVTVVVAAVAVVGTVAWLRPSRTAAPITPGPQGTVLTTTFPLPTGVADLTVGTVTGTLYAATDPVSVLDVCGATASTPDICADLQATVPNRAAAATPQALALDEATHTLYAATWDGHVEVIDSATCNSAVTVGCAQPLASIPVGTHPVGLALDPATRTLYVASRGTDSGGWSVSVVDASACSAATLKTCNRVARTIPMPAAPDAMAVDDTTHTLYVRVTAQSLASRVVMLATTACNGYDSTSCALLPGAPLGLGRATGAPDGMAIDPLSGTLYVTSYTSSTMTMLDTATCNATQPSGCPTNPVTVPTPQDPVAVAVDGGRHRLFVVSYGDSTVTVLDTRSCSDTETSGCSAGASTLVGAGPQTVTVDASNGRVYVGSSSGKSLSIIQAG